MKKYSVIFFLKQSLNGLLMNSIMSITSVLILASCLILTGFFTLLVLNTNLNLDRIDSLNRIVFIIDRKYESDEEIERIKEEIRQLDNVESIKFINKDENLQKIKKQFEVFSSDENLFEGVMGNDNPLPHSIEIEYKNINDFGTLDYQLRLITGLGKLKTQVDIAESIKNIKNIVMLILVWFLGVMFIIAVFIILNTVKLSVHSRKSEIIIMRYIGATNFFIVFPFLLEGVIIGLVSALITYFSQSYLYNSIVIALIKRNAGLEFIPFTDVNIIFCVGFIVVGVFCGLLGSGISTRRYLKA